MRLPHFGELLPQRLQRDEKLLYPNVFLPAFQGYETERGVQLCRVIVLSSQESESISDDGYRLRVERHGFLRQLRHGFPARPPERGVHFWQQR